jgi:hypothetical protein
MSSSSDDMKGLERGRAKCDSCNTPVSMLLVIKTVDELSGNLVEEHWCKRCFLDKGETAQRHKEEGR